MNAASFIVVGRDGRLACKGFRGVTGAPFIWGAVDTRQPPPDYLLTWDTQDGAQKFANMNGGNVTTVMECFYAPRQAAAI
jgi:hypothetical protein